nr:retrovirus-related Pol polyprotein from transposon TNT 1-94 [Tanacetum cinerariifolium]
MILNTLDHLGKFEAKEDEGYFIGYSLSSKAFRVFNKRTKKVEENLHVEFLENKLIEKGVGLNGLFGIDTLTNSMNYVLVVSAGTTSTNFSGTKDAASQDVKKDVFEDILGVTTNTGDTNRVEADLSNMKNNISACPTPTFRIHKDHPTSQIISHVDTLVQTITKSMEMEE